MFLARTIDEISVQLGRSAWGVEETLVRARQVLSDARDRRPRPQLDDKVLTAWNGLMIATLARAAHVFEGQPRAVPPLAAAQRAAAFVRDRLWDDERLVLHRRHRDGQASIDGYAEDYACLVWGLLELFQVDGEVAWLDWARTLQRRQNQLFWDEQNGGWFSTTGSDPSVLLRLKENYDGAEPSAGSVSAGNLQTLAHLTGELEVFDRLERALARFGPRLGHAARVVPLMTAVLSHYHAGTSQLVIIGDREGADALMLRRRVAAHYLPFAVRVNVEPGPHQEALARVLPFIRGMAMRKGRATAYVCADFSCQAPVSDPDELDAQLDALRQDVR